MVEDENEYIQLSDLFVSLGIIEKGIEKIYHYLLFNKKIDNLKEVCDKYDLLLKRGYKICSVLSELELIQIYDRPMKVSLATPLVPIWQKLINKRIEKLKFEFDEVKDKCSSSLDDFIKKYDLKSQEQIQEPVELIIFDIKNIEDIYYPFFTKSQCKIATGIRYENPLIMFIKNNSKDKIEEIIRNRFVDGISKIKENLKNITVQVIINNDLLTELLNSKEYSILSEQIEIIDFKFKSVNVRITKDNFSNFSLTDNELIQPSFDPTNKLMGCYISRNENIYQIFNNKFNEIFDKGIPIKQFNNSLTEKETFAISLL